MTDLLSVYEAKTHFSEVIRLVRTGRTITISYRGEPVAEIRPAQQPESFAARLEDLRQRGMLIRSKERPSNLTPGEPSPGALDRFLAERHE